MNLPSIRQLIGVAGGVALLGGVVSSGAAQQGSIAGRVTDQASQQPVSGAQVVVEGSVLRGQTNQEGRYRIERLPLGEYRVQVRLIGYATAVRPVTLTAGEPAQLDFTLTAAPVSLEGVTVVAATGEEQRAREIPNTVSHIDASKINQEALPTNLADLLNARAPGVQVLPSGGTTGTGSRIRIRGATSVSLSNEPIIVVDGVRVENGAESNSIGVGGQTPSRLNDLNPDEIESIEIVKGPAATSLYGTDAVNGAIQIRTKRGRPGPTRWTGYVEGGALNDHADWPANFTSRTNTGASCSLTAAALPPGATGACVIDTVRSFNPLKVFSPFQTGSRQQYGLSASGGSEATTFFLSGDFEREKGVYHPNDLRRVSLRANVRNQVSRLLDIAVSTGYVSSNLGLPQNDNNSAGIASSGLLGCAQLACPIDTAKHGYGFLTPEQAFNIFVAQGIERFTGSLNANFRPTSFLSIRAVAGTDVTNRFDQQTIPPGLVPLNQNTLDGNRISNRTQLFNYTAQLTSLASFRLSSELVSNTSVGVQYFKNVFAQTVASGRKLAKGSTSLAGVVIPTVNETTNEFVTIGEYVQEELGLRDRIFFTGALRNDRNSAFGSSFGNIVYPKVGGSWVISDEPFFPRSDLMNSVRLRAAWGRSGRQPGPNDAIAFFNPVAVAASGDVPGITDSSVGNQSLKPERTSEWEAGFDADLWRQRVHLEFTYYDKSSKDALIRRRLAPSLGVSTDQFLNLGQVSNKGVEILLSAQPVNTPRFSWNVTASAWGNRNRLIDLGIDPATGKKIKPIIFGLGGASQRHQEGYPLGGYWDFPYTFNDANKDGLIAASEVTVGPAQVFQGTPLPTHGGTVSTEVSFLRHFRLYGLLDGRFGNKLDHSTEEFRCLLGICRGRRDPKAPLADQARAVATVFNGLETGYFEDAGFVKLREVSLTFFAPETWASRLGASALSVTLTGRNLVTWTNYTGVDPELNDAGQSNFNTADFLTQPPVRYFIARVNLTF